jgi:hypothetical protein
MSNRVRQQDSFFAVRLPRGMADEIRRIATQEGNGASAVARRLLAGALSRELSREFTAEMAGVDNEGRQ